MEPWARFALVAAITAALTSALARLLQRGKPAALDGVSGTITPEKVTAIVTVIGGTGMAIMGGWVFLWSGAAWGPIALACMGIAVAGFMAPSLSHMHDVRWTAEVIEGPSKLFGPTLGAARTAIAWSDAVRTGATITGYWYVEARDGRRVYWSYLYKGHGALAAVIRMRCPGLKIPPS